MGGADKLLAPLDGRPVLAHSLAAIAACAELTDVVVVTSAANRAAVARVARACGGGKVRALVTGGAERQDSVAAGLAALPNVEIVAIHDGARPLVVAEDFAAGVQAARSTGAAVAGAPMVDTVKRVDANERVVETPTRSELRAIATPQVFRRELLSARPRRGGRSRCLGHRRWRAGRAARRAGRRLPDPAPQSQDHDRG